MKKFMLTMLLAVTMITAALIFVSCGDDDPDYPEISTLYGHWQVTSLRQDENAAWHAWQYESTYLHFYSNGLYEAVGYFGEGKGRWSADKSIVSVNLDSGVTTRYRILDGKVGEWIELHATSLYGSMDIRLNYVSEFERNKREAQDSVNW